MNPSRVSSRHLLLIGLVAGLFSLLVCLSWVGYISSDDGIYVSQALLWTTGDPYLPTSHWGFRYPVVLALAGVMASAGNSMTSIAAVPVIYSLLLLGGAYFILRRFASGEIALLCAALLATWPLLVVKTSVVNADIPEAFFAILSIGLFVEATRHGSPSRFLFLSGLLAGLAMLTRETAFGLGFAYGLFFLAGAYFDRKYYLWGALGILCILGFEAAFYVSQGEGVLYRFSTIIESHGSLELTTRDFDSGTGNVSDSRFFGPILALLVNQEVGLMFYFTIPAAWFLLRKASLENSERVLVQALTVLAGVWIIWISYSGAVRPMPRYYSVAGVASLMLTAMWLYYLPSRKVAGWLAILLIGGNLISLSVENTHPRFSSRTLAAYVLSNDVTVYTDSQTYSRAADILQLSAPEYRVRLREGQAPSGGLMFHNPNGRGFTDEHGNQIRARVASGEWQSVAVWQPPRRGIGHILGILGLEFLVPEKARQLVIYGNRPVELFKVGPHGP